ncbi:hypothetical protein GCM10010441_27600 [Kitasatospora paracochleata]|uniref:Uncharacterized protein n=1 Tax=Kitasatospora paracochleata TaxID=58354 RepID=A0ABT1IX37_9ACTN|nr:hypothetical protein [Kitasatospora paracochleata]MCP2309478.1 hypothetical protein [Kitasatospora paracochleata]
MSGMVVDPQSKESLSPRGHQRTGPGRALIAAGWTLRVAGIVVGLGGTGWFRAGFRDGRLPAGLHQPLWWLGELGAVVAAVLGLRLLGVGRRLVVRGKQHTTPTIDSFDRVLGTRYVLYLRPFYNDPILAEQPLDISGGSGTSDAIFFISGLTHEEALTRRFRRFGRVVAVGRPNERLPLPGASRGYLPDDDQWKKAVSRLIRHAHVVLLTAGDGPGTVWEFTEALRILPPERLVLLVYGTPDDYDSFRRALGEYYASRSSEEPGAPDSGRWPALPALPDFPPPARPRRPWWEVVVNGGRSRLRWDFVLKGVVVFDPDWRATFVRFDPTAVRVPSVLTLNRLVKRRLRPTIEQLAALPPRG